MASTPYPYSERLRSEQSEIRLLTLHPGIPESPLVCQLSTTSLSTAPKYSALSYVWGSPDKSKRINIDGYVHPVTENLESALRRIRDKSQQLLLWIDAVCINQADVEERNGQVRMMGDIYSSAASVLLWIGEADNESNDAFDSMPFIAQVQLNEQVWVDTGDFLANVDDRPWFNRVWTLQEMVLAKRDPIMVCGLKAVTWSVFMAAWMVTVRRVFTENGITRRSDQATNKGSTRRVVDSTKDRLNSLRKGLVDRGSLSLYEALWLSRSSEATEPKDKYMLCLVCSDLRSAMSSTLNITRLLPFSSLKRWRAFSTMGKGHSSCLV